MEGSGGELSGYTPEELELSDWAHRKLVKAFGLETEAWATDVVRRAADRLHGQRGDAPAVEPVVLWLQEMTAFAVPGPYVYVSRELLQRCGSEDPVAFVLGHEIAHDDLGHTAIFTGRLDKLRGVLGGKAIALVLHAAEHLAFSHEMESQ